MSVITKLTVQVECDGAACLVNFEPGHEAMIAQLLGAFCKDGILQLVKLPSHFKFEKMADYLGDKS